MVLILLKKFLKVKKIPEIQAILRLLLLISRTVEDFKLPFLHFSVFSRFYMIA